MEDLKIKKVNSGAYSGMFKCTAMHGGVFVTAHVEKKEDAEKEIKGYAEKVIQATEKEKTEDAFYSEAKDYREKFLVELSDLKREQLKAIEAETKALIMEDDAENLGKFWAVTTILRKG